MTNVGCDEVKNNEHSPTDPSEKKRDTTIYGKKGEVNSNGTAATLKGDYYEIPMEEESDSYVVNPDRMQPHKLQKEVNVLKVMVGGLTLLVFCIAVLFIFLYLTEKAALQKVIEQMESEKQDNLQASMGANKMEVGLSKEYPATSCKQLRQDYPHLNSGLYWLRIGQVYCDMDPGTGGWTQIGSAEIKSESEVDVDFHQLTRDDVTKLNEVTQNRFLLSAKGMRRLQSLIHFTRVRFYCWKPSHGRTVNIHTRNNTFGLQVLSYMMRQHDRWPVGHNATCDSYRRLSDDNSVLTDNCRAWYAQRWDNCGDSRNRMYCVPMMVLRQDSPIGLEHEFSLDPKGYKGQNCDDHPTNDNYSRIGVWKFFVQ